MAKVVPKVKRRRPKTLYKLKITNKYKVTSRLNPLLLSQLNPIPFQRTYPSITQSAPSID